MRKEEACRLARCLKPLLGRQKRYCSRSHRTLAYNGRQVERKKNRARENRLIYRIDSLAPQDRRAVFLSVIHSLPISSRRLLSAGSLPQSVPNHVNPD